ncbi:MAG: hypothetical protein NZO16_05925 [Deltaproteobacteria bacterium]|nr:hypothetical protein [Deltaproteobacteria bacterium]
MKIRKIKLLALHIPFKAEFSHASKKRTSTETLICAVETSNHIGFGEGCPRDYVTSEDYGTAKNFFSIIIADIPELDSFQTLKEFVKKNQHVIDKNPAAWCAIETALLDVLAKERQVSVRGLLFNPEESRQLVANQRFIRCTAVFGISSDKGSVKRFVDRYKQLGFVDFKIKITGKLSQDLYLIQSINDLVPNSRIRIDANNLWENEKLALNYLGVVRENVWAVEEPLRSRSLVDYRRLYSDCGIKIILDESFKKIDDILYLDDCFIPNLRISKLGGLLRATEITEILVKRGRGFIIGCHVGETSILTACQMIVASMYPQGLLAFEGGFSSYLLETDISKPELKFNSKGLLDISDLKGSGLGVNVEFSDRYLEQLCIFEMPQ